MQAPVRVQDLELLLEGFPDVEPVGHRPDLDVKDPNHLEIDLVSGLELERLHEEERQVLDDHHLDLGEDLAPVRLIDTGPEFELQVEDTGVGIPADALPHIFDAYRQAHRGVGGTGLGLAIVRGIADVHGGRVTAESQEGKGSRFTVLLPRS